MKRILAAVLLATMVNYKGNEGVAACSIHVYSELVVKEIADYAHAVFEQHIADGENTPGLAVISASSFPKLEMTPNIKERYCSIATWLPSVSLKEYLQDKSLTEKNKLLPVIAFQVISALRYLGSMGFHYDSIGPESIRIRDGMADGVPYVILTDLHMIKGLYKKSYGATSAMPPQGDEPESYENESGFRPPEDYQLSDDDRIRSVGVKKRISWLVGAIIYDALTGMPPYGFTQSSDGVKPHGIEELRRVMVGHRTSEGTCLPAKISNPYLNALMEKLMNCIADDRPLISKLDLELVKRLADSSKIKVTNESVAKGTWFMAAAALDAINPFSRH
ncbi:hypothetical protein THASP1DRAFT_24350 [Thamnocephalis sphaerospora]|uniref:Protein kinase domain-containing protein n=1 Tax=Thamnocephalis sphaerospora TaxID=78915 RepID=A0A4P9XNJ9_9FUNG|nr:hypothetical protein THASP1DRAFT_24350 [Thamnocephalis sphaerospora]|eukprot:RKP07515.1 hypothetical protein THASP1DRAFT_24350 [Thamnocephalis sphaerospora]